MKKSLVTVSIICTIFLAACSKNNGNNSNSPMPTIDVKPTVTNPNAMPGSQMPPKDEEYDLDLIGKDLSEEGAVEEVTPGSTEANEVAVDVAKTAMNQPDVQEAAVVITNDQKCLVAIIEEVDKRIDQKQIDAIIEAANGLETRITTDSVHFATIKALETASNGAAVAQEKIKEVWEAIKS